ncbi:MAG: DUF421 domain-containing protein [Ilumatobacter sp.]|nr:DUF421 domain-containing protein [Ilumatobacter sp.]
MDAVVMVAFLVAVTRINGLRSFSKMSGFDFAVTVAMGSVLASVVVSGDTPFLTGMAALAALFAVQALIARMRIWWDPVEHAVDNSPVLLMDGGRIIDENLRATKVSHGDLIAKLREANVLDPNEIRAVVFETTGDISVLHGPADGAELSDMVMDGVQRTT